MTKAAMAQPFFTHAQALCESSQIGDGTHIWAFTHVLPNARVGRDCNIGDGVFIENDVVVGDRVTVKCGVQLCDGVRLEDDVFVGPNVTFANEQFPRSRQMPEILIQTHVRRGAVIGANATILPGIEIGADAMVGAGSVVTRNVPPNAVVVGNPARVVRFIGDADPQKLSPKRAPSTITARDMTPQDLGVGRCQLWQLPRLDDARGSLIVTQYDQHMPFIPRRTFFIANVPEKEIRGRHAHRQCHQFLIVLHGSVTALIDDGKHRQEVVLSQPETGLFMPAGTWGTQRRFSDDAVMIVFTSHDYDASDYIHQYDDFQAYVGA